MKADPSREPDFQEACAWWEDLPNIWTPLGWRDHMFRFNVLWNGTILAEPDRNRRTAPWARQGIQLGVVPHVADKYDDSWHSFIRHDDRSVLQGWTADAAPVLWTEWTRDGLLTREYAFAHVPGGPLELKTGIEPLFAWLRFEVHALCPAVPLEDWTCVHLLFHAPHYGASMNIRNNRLRFEKSKYPRALAPEADAYSAAAGLRVLEEDGRVRLAAAPGAPDVTAAWHAASEAGMSERPGCRLTLRLPARKGARVDVLLPMLPTDRAVFDAELALGYAGALRETRAFWRRATASRSVFEVPEPEINDALRQSARISNLLCERNPETGKLCKLTGSWIYADLWATPMAMELVMLLDMFGHHATVERYLDILRDEQGSVKPPGDAFALHPGYFSTPARYKSVDWLSDNGAVLWTICSHALLSGGRAFVERFLPAIVRSCEWIRDARAQTGHGGYEGVLPPAVATDAWTKIQAVWSIGWNYRGLTAAVRVLRQAGHPRAAEFAAEAEAYRSAFLAALRDKCRKMPTWQDARGKKRRFVPTALAGEKPDESRHAFYLDGGPLFLVFSGLVPAHDPLMQDALAWFREGPQHRLYRRDSDCWQLPVLDHEMSSCEPCYSWNVFHSWQTGDRARYFEGMYSVLAGALSRGTRVSCETRGGITGLAVTAALPLCLARLAVLDDQIEPGRLHLLRLMPRAWLKPGDQCRFRALPTEYGPVTLETRVSRDGRSLDVIWKPAFRAAAPAVRLHLPPGIRSLRLNGRRTKVGKRWIEL